MIKYLWIGVWRAEMNSKFVEFFITWKDQFPFSRNFFLFFELQNLENSLTFEKLIKLSEPINRLTPIEKNAKKTL
jgi:hypothetical protein